MQTTFFAFESGMDGLDRSSVLLECLWDACDIIVHVCCYVGTHIQTVQLRNVSWRVNLRIPWSLSWTMPMMGLFNAKLR